MADNAPRTRSGAAISHGICPSCLQQRLAALPPPSVLPQPFFGGR